MFGKFLGLLCGQIDFYYTHGAENCLLFCLDVMISLFVSLCKSLGISIMFVLFLLNGGERHELWSMGGNATIKGHGRQRDYKGDVGFEAKYTG
jgi:hypothetical protein